MKTNEIRQTAFLELYEMQDMSLTNLANFVLEKSLPLTESPIGFFGFIDDDQSMMTIHAWSREAMKQCAVKGKPIKFPVEQAGLWGEAVRQQQPVIINDFDLTRFQSKTMPEGHIPIRRFMIVPLVEQEKTVVVSAVGNKEKPYTDDDVLQLRLLLQGMWQINRQKRTETALVLEREALQYANEKLKKEIADRKVVEEALRQSEIKFRTVADFTYDWEYWINSDGCYEYISPSFERISGYSPNELVDDPKLLQRIIYPEDRELVDRHFTEDFLLEGACHLDFRIQCKDGEVKWISHLCQPVYDSEGEYLGRRASNRDVSLRKHTEVLLEKERNKLEQRVRERTEDLEKSNFKLKETYEAFKLTRFSIDHANDLLYWLNKDGNIVDVNESTCKRLGYSREELLSMNVADVDPEHTLAEYKDMWENLRKQGVWVIKTHHVSKSGKSIPVEIHLNYINYQGQEYNCAFARDITEHRELEKLVAIEDKMSSLGRVAAGIAHEIRNPLSTINIHLSSLKNTLAQCEKDKKTDSGVNEILFEMEQASNKINAVVKRVIDFSKPAQQHPKIIDINTCVSAPFVLSNTTFRKAGIDASLVLAEDLPSTYGDSHSLEQVVLNLLTNAIEELAESRDTKKLEVRTAHKTLHGKSEIIISVADSGRGIPPDIIDKIFEPFCTGKTYGSGIGLSICHRIVRDHQGTIEVLASKIGGAEFCVSLPVRKTKVAI